MRIYWEWFPLHPFLRHPTPSSPSPLFLSHPPPTRPPLPLPSIHLHVCSPPLPPPSLSIKKKRIRSRIVQFYSRRESQRWYLTTPNEARMSPEKKDIQVGKLREKNQPIRRAYYPTLAIYLDWGGLRTLKKYEVVENSKNRHWVF